MASFSCSTFTIGEKERVRVPRGPCTVMEFPRMVAVTLSGMMMGFFAKRDINIGYTDYGFLRIYRFLIRIFLHIHTPKTYHISNNIPPPTFAFLASASRSMQKLGERYCL